MIREWYSAPRRKSIGGFGPRKIGRMGPLMEYPGVTQGKGEKPNISPVTSVIVLHAIPVHSLLCNHPERRRVHQGNTW